MSTTTHYLIGGGDQQQGSREIYETLREGQQRAKRLRTLERQRQAKLWMLRKTRVDEGKVANPGPGVKYGDPEWVKPPREAICGTAGFGRGSVTVMGNEAGTASHYQGLARCGKGWTCPYCHAVLMRKKAEDITEAVRRWEAMGNHLAMLTLTVAHTAEQPLAEVWEMLAGAYRAMNKSLRGIKDRLGIEGSIRATEVTIGANGWHPHYHILLFVNRPIGEIEAAEIKAALYDLWAVQVESKGGRSSWEHGLDVVPIEFGTGAAAYITKIAEEMTDAEGAKEGHGSMTPFQLLDNPTPRNEKLWDEWATVTKGKAAVQWSKGLRDKLGIAKEKSNREIMADEGQELTEVKGFVGREAWKGVAEPEQIEWVRDSIAEGSHEEVAAAMGWDIEWKLIIGDGGWPGFVPLFRKRYDERNRE